MSHTASFLTDYLFPGLLIGCGCLGLGVVTAIGHRPSGSRQKEHQAAKAPPAASMTPARARPAMPASPAVRALPSVARPRVAPLRRVSRPTRLRLSFGKRQTRVSDVDRERLRIFWAAAKPGPKARVTVVGHAVGRRGRRRARRRARRVVALLRQMGVAAASIAEPQVAPDDGGAGGSAVTIVIGKR